MQKIYLKDPSKSTLVKVVSATKIRIIEMVNYEKGDRESDLHFYSLLRLSDAAAVVDNDVPVEDVSRRFV